MARIVISEFMDSQAVATLAQHHTVVHDTGLVDDRQALTAALEAADALIVRNRTQVNDVLLQHAPRLRVVGRLGVGLDNIDLEACRQRDIQVKPAQGGNAISVAEYVITGALVLRRGAYTENEAMLAGQWPRQALMGREVFGATMGLVGFGAIAREVAHRASALGMNVLAYDPHVSESDSGWALATRFNDLTAMLASSDVVSLHVPLTSSTYHLINADLLAKMKTGAVLINAARGGVVDESALARSLANGCLKGAMLDVFEHEPLPAGSHFEGVPNLILTPHIAGVTEESNARISRITADHVMEVLASEEGA